MSKPLFIGLLCIIAGIIALPLIAGILRGPSDGPPAAALSPAAVVDAPSPPPAPTPVPGVPSVVRMEPANGASNVSTQLAALVVTFNEPMAEGFSWTGGGPNFPEATGPAYWSADHMTCVMPVRLKPNWSYRLGLNSPSFKNFRSASGKPLTPVQWTFSTGS